MLSDPKFETKIAMITRNHSSRMRTARFPTVNASVTTSNFIITENICLTSVTRAKLNDKMAFSA